MFVRWSCNPRIDSCPVRPLIILACEHLRQITRNLFRVFMRL